MIKARKKHAPKVKCTSPSQLTIEGFETPFERSLNLENRWVVLSKLTPWDELINMYNKHIGINTTGRPPISPRIIIGSIIIKHLCNLDDSETVDQISENIYMQYFLGYPCFSDKAPFDASLLTDFRKRIGMEQVNAMNERIAILCANFESQKAAGKEQQAKKKTNQNDDDDPGNKGRLIVDATLCPQDIAHPTDLDLLAEAREKTELLIDILYNPQLHRKKPRAYREIAHRKYLQTAQKRNKPPKVIRVATGK